ncbi:protein-serine,threonine phosphatase [Sarracenia purpurea var. burkii]
MRLLMTEVYSRRRTMKEDEDDSPTKCRERRRRRIEMRRLAAISVAGSSFPADADSGDNCTEGITDPAWSPASSGEDAEVLSDSPSDTAILTPAIDSVPVFGTMSVAGRSRDMEDTICVRTSLCRPEINLWRPVHFFGVYDGHGGTHVASLCRERMHALMEEELMRVGRKSESHECGVGTSSSSKGSQQTAEMLKEAEEGWWRTAMRRCFERMDEVAINTCACGSFGYQCGCHPMEVALAGSTAVVAVVTADRIVVANCGDSRAVLCRAGRALPLSSDHKPDRADELARIEASGGRVIFVNGARVEGILAMSRALGDKFLKPIVTSEPEISFIERDPDDECLILASDGLWDVMSSDLACEVASECLREGNPPAASNHNAMPQMEDEGAGTSLYPSRSASAAALLTRLALGRKSSDNISVIVVDLKRS